MDDMIICALQRPTSRQDYEALRQWRESHSENERQYRLLEELWLLTGAAAPIRETDVLPDLDTIIALAEDEMSDVRRKKQHPPAALRDDRSSPFPSHRGDRWLRGAAVGSLAASLSILGFGLWLFANRADHRVARLAYDEITTGVGERATITLSDGTAIRLGPRSQLRVAQEEDQPVVWLDGRAFFGVEPDPSRTFTVRTEYGEATALGTRFEVRSEEQEFRVIVLEGSVRVSAAGAAVEVGEGLMSQNREGAPPSTSRVENVEQLLDWMGTTLVFRSTPLRRALAEIEHQYGVEALLEDASLGNVTVTATFSEKRLEEVVFVVCEIVGADCTVGDSHVRIRRKATAPRPPTSPR